MSNRTRLPPIGFGTYRLDGRACTEMVRTALEAGYRHVDTARAYGNEAAVGEALERADVPIEEVAVASKVSPRNLGRGAVADSVCRSVEALGIETLDVAYVHWPVGAYNPSATFGALAELRADGIVDRIGASNFTIEQLERALEVTDGSIDVLQVELHPLLGQSDLRSVAEGHGIEVVAHTPLMGGRVGSLPELDSIADRHDTTIAQVSLAWGRGLGVTPIPGSRDPDHLRENLASLELNLDETDRETIDGIDRQERVVDPVFAPW